MQFTYESPELEQESAAFAELIATTLQKSLGDDSSKFKAFWSRERATANPRYVLTIEELEATPAQVKAFFTKDEANDPESVDLRLSLALASLYRKLVVKPRVQFADDSEDYDVANGEPFETDVERLEAAIHALQKKIDAQHAKIAHLSEAMQDFIRATDKRFAELERLLEELEQRFAELKSGGERRSAKRILYWAIVVSTVGVVLNITLTIIYSM